MNKLPWYAAGVHQCICTHAREGAVGNSTVNPGVFPVSTNWTDNLSFVGRENIGVEFDQGSHVLDHWAFGPHHVWVFPNNGSILRMWQPFNGLQIFPTGTNYGPVDQKYFQDIPPPLCKKNGGAILRVKCNDAGYPNDDPAHNDLENVPTSTEALDSLLNGKSETYDIYRAKTKTPSTYYRGKTFTHMAETLNSILQRNKLIETKPCNQWTLREIQDVQARLYTFRGILNVYSYNCFFAFLKLVFFVFL